MLYIKILETSIHKFPIEESLDVIDDSVLRKKTSDIDCLESIVCHCKNHSIELS